MRFLRYTLLLVTAVYGAAIPPQDIPPAAQRVALLESETAGELMTRDDIEIDHYNGGACLANFPLFNINQDNRIDIQGTISHHRDDTYRLGRGLSVRIRATFVRRERYISVFIHNPRMHTGSIVLSNYEHRNSATPRETIDVDYYTLDQSQCIQLPRIDGFWYLQLSD